MLSKAPRTRLGSAVYRTTRATGSARSKFRTRGFCPCQRVTNVCKKSSQSCVLAAGPICFLAELKQPGAAHSGALSMRENINAERIGELNGAVGIFPVERAFFRAFDVTPRELLFDPGQTGVAHQPEIPVSRFRTPP